MAAFGWSVGDLVSAISVVAKVSRALKDVGGAADDYRETVLFLESLNITLTTLHGLYESNVDPSILSGVQSQLELVQKPIGVFTEKVKRKLDSVFNSTKKDKGVRTTLKRTSSQLEWAFWLDKQSQVLNRKILVPLTGIQIQLGIHIHSVLSTIADDFTTKVEKKINDAFPLLLQQNLAPIVALERRRHTEERDANTAIYQKIESLPQIIADTVDISLDRAQQKDSLRSKKLEDYCSLIIETIDRVEERLQQNNDHAAPNVSAGTEPPSEGPQISSLLISNGKIRRANSKPGEAQQTEYSSRVPVESLLKSLTRHTADTSTPGVSELNHNQQPTLECPSAAIGQAWEETAVNFRKLISLLIQAFQEYFVGLWPMFAYLLYQAKLMQKCIFRLPSLLAKDNITFVDALGRSRRIPYMTYGHWETFNNFVLADFQKIPGESHVQKSRFELLASDGLTTLNRSNWKSFVLPNVEISMVVNLSLSVRDGRCPKCRRPSDMTVNGAISAGLATCNNLDCQLKFRLVPYIDRESELQTTVQNKDSNTSSVSVWLEIASSLKKVQYANLREKSNALALADTRGDNPFPQSDGPEPYKHLLGVKRKKDTGSYMPDEIRSHTKALQELKQETTEFELYFKSVQCRMFSLECEICGYFDFNHMHELTRHMIQAHTCIYSCLFDFAGCQHEFAREDQWKCHITSDHLNWLCDIGQCPNEKVHPINHYNKDGYSASKKRHAVALQKRADRANAILQASLRERKSLPSKLNCPVKDCEISFDGQNCWDDRMDHVGKHIIGNTIERVGYLCSKRFLDNTADELFIAWALSEGIVQKVGRNFRLVIPE
ncbi:uncharacterized protein EAF02_009119 [Botrytis sinoallii]|uniref:uncharacterized protein n=1 Tax=Botrytis sinoallii TaxID=1463999 RepID=UPI0019007A60|nr:uncharacterized protein EAF02_009119 [Botrytis sinoallii]KAF7872014.1 hypothetical protein EAF02_009119 [Botrytis sinoallii]